MTGGGSGGHITPILAVAHEVKQIDSGTRIYYVGQTGDSLGDIPAQHPSIDEVYTVRAGKLRRYHGEGWRQLLDIPTVLKNIRDLWLVFVGFWQALVLLRKLRPSAIFIKGGFVGVPVGLAAAVLRIPYVTHDSDALPGLANRIIAPWAEMHAVALPKEIYAYPPEKTITVGVPISHEYATLSTKQQTEVKKQLGLPPDSRVLLVTGGGLGAQRLNFAVADCLPQLLARYKDLVVVQLVGRANETGFRQYLKKHLTLPEQKRVHVKGFITNLYQYSGVADVVITRAGGTSMAEFAAQSKACVVVPNPILAGGHQLKNAQVLAEQRAVIILPNDKLVADHSALMPVLTDLLDNPKKIAQLGTQLHKMAQSDAAKQLAVVLLKVEQK